MNSESNYHIEYRQEAIKLIIDAWDLNQNEIFQDTDREAEKLDFEISKMKEEVNSFTEKIEKLEKENENLEEYLTEILDQNEKLKFFKESLKNSLKSTDSYKTSTPRFIKSINSDSSSNLEKTLNGKNFFKEARIRLSYETFSVFLSYVKKLNDKGISKEKALFELKDIFGEENADLHESFCCLLLHKS
jgi:predicted RNase H-like nuclease (RuvC/YqgF family)